MKDKIALLFKRNEKLGAAPILFVGLGLLIIFALLYFFVLNKEDGNLVSDAPADSAEVSEAADETFFGKIKGIFGFAEEEALVEEEIIVPQTPSIPESALTLDEELIKEEEDEEEIIIEEDLDFKLEEVEIENVGRRDPMKAIVGANVGTFDKERIDEKPADLKDESKNYFGGIAIDDIILDNISSDELGDNKLRGDFIVNGSLIPNLEVGDYLLELYYVKEFNSKENYVIIQYKDDTYKLTPQNIVSGKANSNSGTGDYRK